MSAHPASAAQPLRGMRIIDLTAVLMGPYATQLLGDMGADVVKVEAPEGDMVRLIGPARNAGMGPVFLNTNRSKRSIVLDLKTEDGKAALLRLVADADIFVYNVRPQAMARLGLAYEELARINPRIIYVGVFGYGQDGPYAARPAYDDLMQGASTLAAMFARSTGGPPQYVPAAIADRITGLVAATTILGAVVERQASGMGQRIDVPMFETMVNFILSDHLAGLSFDPPLDAGGYARLLSRGRRPYRTRDGYVCALIYTDKQWRSLFRLLGRETEFDEDPRFRSLSTRTEHIDAIYAEVERILATRTTAEWLDVLGKVDIPSMPVHDLESIFDDEHLRATGHFGTEEHPSEGRLRTLRHGSTWSRTQPRATRHAPLQGEHTLEILREAGYSDAQIDAMIASGSAGTTPSKASA
ncbi:CaiB/BaiF CoA transferase family protein [Variovorax sp. M-6]|uniref:CaiB/BaiF CoA transferase family protein n=1 Tax=Variovorax sp. M-6 TaxID=3233041 RepID=UPI003F94F602